MHTLRMFLALAATFLAAAAASAADSLCPDTIDVKQSGALPASDWSLSYSTAPVSLEMVTFYSGRPEEGASLVYDDWVNAKASSTATWRFPKDPRGYWVKCSYRGTTAELSKALQGVSSCRVTYERGVASASGLPAIRSIACQ